MHNIATAPVKTEFDTLVETLTSDIKKEVETFGVFTTSTCDTNSFGWSLNKHNAMHTIKRKGIEGLYIQLSVKFEVTDWMIVRG